MGIGSKRSDRPPHSCLPSRLDWNAQYPIEIGGPHHRYWCPSTRQVLKKPWVALQNFKNLNKADDVFFGYPPLDQVLLEFFVWLKLLNWAIIGEETLYINIGQWT